MKRFLKNKEIRKIRNTLLTISLIYLFFGLTNNITGAVIGNLKLDNTPLSFIGIFLLIISFFLLASEKRSLEAIIVPTGSRGEIDGQRAIAGAKIYKTHPNSKIIISGIFNDRKLLGSQSLAIYKTLRRNGVPRADIEFEHESKDSLENAKYTSKILKEEDIHKITIISDQDHARRLGMLFRKAKEEEIAPKDLKIRSYSKGIKKAYNEIKAQIAYTKDIFRKIE